MFTVHFSAFNHSHYTSHAFFFLSFHFLSHCSAHISYADLAAIKRGHPARRVLCTFSAGLTGPSGPAWEPDLDPFHAEYSRCLANKTTSTCQCQ